MELCVASFAAATFVQDGRDLPGVQLPRLTAGSAISIQPRFLAGHGCALSRIGRERTERVTRVDGINLAMKCRARFRPCIDIHKGKVKQIVGSTLQDAQDGDSSLVTNFISDKLASEYALIYKDDGLTGGHVIMLGADTLSQTAAMEAILAYPGGLQVGGGIHPSNAASYIDGGASHVIVTSAPSGKGKQHSYRSLTRRTPLHCSMFSRMGKWTLIDLKSLPKLLENIDLC